MSGHLGLGGEGGMKLQCPECGSDVDLRLIFTGVVELNRYLNECTGHTSRVIPVIIAWHCGTAKPSAKSWTKAKVGLWRH